MLCTLESTLYSTLSLHCINTSLSLQCICFRSPFYSMFAFSVRCITFSVRCITVQYSAAKLNVVHFWSGVAPLTGEPGQGSLHTASSQPAQPGAETKMRTFVIIMEIVLRYLRCNVPRSWVCLSFNSPSSANPTSISSRLDYFVNLVVHYRTSPKLYKESNGRAAYVNVCPR